MLELLTRLDAIGAETGDALERFMNDEEMYMKYVLAFPTEPTMGKLTQAVEARDYEAAEKAVHALKGIVTNLGFLPLADAAIDMLGELRDGEQEEAMETFADVQREYARFCKVIQG